MQVAALCEGTQGGRYFPTGSDGNDGGQPSGFDLFRSAVGVGGKTKKPARRFCVWPFTESRTETKSRGKSRRAKSAAVFFFYFFVKKTRTYRTRKESGASFPTCGTRARE